MKLTECFDLIDKFNVVNTYDNCKPFRNTEEFRNNGNDILNHHVDCFGADNDVLCIYMDD